MKQASPAKPPKLAKIEKLPPYNKMLAKDHPLVQLQHAVRDELEAIEDMSLMLETFFQLIREDRHRNDECEANHPIEPDAGDGDQFQEAVREVFGTTPESLDWHGFIHHVVQDKVVKIGCAGNAFKDDLPKAMIATWSEMHYRIKRLQFVVEATYHTGGRAEHASKYPGDSHAA